MSRELLIMEARKGRTWPIRGKLHARDVRVGDTVRAREDVLVDRYRTVCLAAWPSFKDPRLEAYMRATQVWRIGSRTLYLPGMDGHHRPASLAALRLLQAWDRWPDHGILLDYSRLDTQQALVPLVREHGVHVTLLWVDVAEELAHSWSVTRQLSAARSGRRISRIDGETHVNLEKKLHALEPYVPSVHHLTADRAVDDLEAHLLQKGLL